MTQHGLNLIVAKWKMVNDGTRDSFRIEKKAEISKSHGLFTHFFTEFLFDFIQIRVQYSSPMKYSRTNYSNRKYSIRVFNAISNSILIIGY